MLENWKERIIIDPKILVGKPVIKGTRMAVEFVIELLSNGWHEEEILKNYPQLTMEDITAALKYAAELVPYSSAYWSNGGCG